MITKNYNHYNLNPPEPVILEPQYNQDEDYMDELIAEHNFEESYENQHIKYFDYVDRLILNELIKNEPKQTI